MTYFNIGICKSYRNQLFSENVYLFNIGCIAGMKKKCFIHLSCLYVDLTGPAARSTVRRRRRRRRRLSEKSASSAVSVSVRALCDPSTPTFRMMSSSSTSSMEAAWWSSASMPALVPPESSVAAAGAPRPVPMIGVAAKLAARAVPRVASRLVGCLVPSLLNAILTADNITARAVDVCRRRGRWPLLWDGRGRIYSKGHAIMLPRKGNGVRWFRYA